jgi:Protein of unknown function (DUF1549)/Protein of unknown function (DUF1553)
MIDMIAKNTGWMVCLGFVSIFIGVSSAVEWLPVDERFTSATTDECPDFRKHVLPLLGRMGCNGRACHGSFQGQGGFRLSLFGHDFSADHRSIREGDPPRIDEASPVESLLLYKPTHADEHGGGERIKIDSWQFHLIRRWLEAGARGPENDHLAHAKLEIIPNELLFSAKIDCQAVRVKATWADGTVEDVTPLCRYQVNNESIATVDADGIVTCKDSGDTHLVAFYDHGVAIADIIKLVSDQNDSSVPGLAVATKLDEFIQAKLLKLGIMPSTLCTDGEFSRRVSLDLTGTLPNPDEIQSFVADPSSDKRARKIEELLRRPTYVARWTTKLCDITGNSPKHFQDQAPPEEYAQDWYAWIARRVEANMPYDKIIEGIVMGRSRDSTQSYEDYIAQQSTYYRNDSPKDFSSCDTMPYFWAKQTMRTPEERSLNVSYSFLGVRIECAQCHKHPFDRWTQDDFKGFTAIFERIGFGVPPRDKKSHQAMLTKLNDKGNQAQRERARLMRAQRGEIVPWQEVFLSEPGKKVEKGKVVDASANVVPKILGGDLIDAQQFADPRQALIQWMREKDNPYFARSFINRVWAEYFGLGIINPTDDLNQANPPSNSALLNYLNENFIAKNFDMKWLHREIVNSHAYQRSLDSNETNRHDERNFSRAVARRLPAATLFDAIEQSTAGSEVVAMAGVEVSERAIGPKGGALVGKWKSDEFASKVFGRSQRDSICDCSASNEANLLQAIYMHNDKDIHAAIERKSGWLQEVRKRLSKIAGRDLEHETELIVKEAFLRTINRPPTNIELHRVSSHIHELGDPVDGVRELLWGLLNTREFITNH